MLAFRALFLCSNVLYIFATEHGYSAFFAPNTINFIMSSLSKHSKCNSALCLGHLGFYLLPRFTQLPG